MMAADSFPPSLVERVKQVFVSIRRAAERVGRNPKDIHLVAATKMVMAERMRQAHEAGIQIFGENRLQEAQGKREELSDISTVAWHFIGRIQRRKIKDIVGNYDVIHSVESLEHARLMNKQAAELAITQKVLLEVNVGREDTKGGYLVPELQKALPELDALSHLHIRGLMTIPPVVENAEKARPYFRQLRELAERINQQAFPHIQMNELSMGMSGDYHVAVEEGATMVRVGSAIFGSRMAVM